MESHVAMTGMLQRAVRDNAALQVSLVRKDATLLEAREALVSVSQALPAARAGLEDIVARIESELSYAGMDTPAG